MNRFFPISHFLQGTLEKKNKHFMHFLQLHHILFIYSMYYFRILFKIYNLVDIVFLQITRDVCGVFLRFKRKRTCNVGGKVDQECSSHWWLWNGGKTVLAIESCACHSEVGGVPWRFTVLRIFWVENKLSPKMHASHLCHNKTCVKIDHLSNEPQSINNARECML